MQTENTKISESFPGWGDRLRQARKDKGVSQADLARAVGYKRETSISEIENGRVQTAPLPVLAKIAEVLDVDLHWLITGQRSPSAEAALQELRGVFQHLIPYTYEYAMMLQEQVEALEKGSADCPAVQPGLHGVSYRMVDIRGHAGFVREKLVKVLAACTTALAMLQGGRGAADLLDRVEGQLVEQTLPLTRTGRERARRGSDNRSNPPPTDPAADETE